MATTRYTYNADNLNVHVTMPDGKLSMTYPTSKQPGVVLTHLHPGGTLTIPPHWHEIHTEHMRVLQGYLLITIGTITRLYGPEDGVADIPPFHIHTISQGTVPAAQPQLLALREVKKGWENEDVIFEEWTSPLDGQKEVFFRNTFGFYKDYFEPVITGQKPILRSIPGLIPHFVEMVNQQRAMDNFALLFPLKIGVGSDGKAIWAARMATYGLYRIISMISYLCGFSSWRKEYTPVELHAVCRSMTL